MLEGRSVIVVVPAFREEAHVGAVIATMPSFVDAIVVVDDGSPDATAVVTRAADDRRVVLVRHAVRRGVGAAIVTGYVEALRLTKNGSDAIVVMAGDGQMDPADLERVTRPVVRGDADYVKGERFSTRGVRRTMGWPRWIGGRVFSFLTSIAVGQRITDSQCGFTAIARRAAAGLDLADVWPSFGYPNDLLGQLAARGFSIREVPVRPVYGAESSKLRMRHLPPIFFLLGRAALRRKRAERGVTRADDAKKRDLRSRSSVSS
jgi:glycosyltransferase involved in cell wall biosynthesis